MSANPGLSEIPKFSIFLQQNILMQDENVIEMSHSSVSKKTKATSELEQVYFSHYSSLVSMARMLVDDVNSAGDVVQEAFLKALVTQPVFKNSDALSYMKTAVMNNAKSHLRKRGTSRKHLSAVKSEDLLIAENEEEVSEAALLVLDVLSGLPKRQRECIALSHTYSMTHKEIAIQLGISEGSVKQHISRGMKSISNALGGAK